MQIYVGNIVIEKRTKRLASVTATNKDWQIEIAYIDEEGKDLHPNAIAWTHPSNVKRLSKENGDGSTLTKTQ